MKSLVICKTCGYIMEESKVGDVCPACGVPAKLFEPYKSKISDRRRAIMKLDIHPITVHAPQALAFTLLVFSVGALVLHGTLRDNLETAVIVLSVAFPFTVLAGVGTGLFAGKTRFKKITTPLLVRKIVLGAVFLIIAVVGALITLLGGATGELYLVYMLLVSCSGLGCATILGLIGAKLVGAAFPG